MRTLALIFLGSMSSLTLTSRPSFAAESPWEKDKAHFEEIQRKCAPMGGRRSKECVPAVLDSLQHGYSDFHFVFDQIRMAQELSTSLAPSQREQMIVGLIALVNAGSAPASQALAVYRDPRAIAPLKHAIETLPQDGDRALALESLGAQLAGDPQALEREREYVRSLARQNPTTASVLGNRSRLMLRGFYHERSFDLAETTRKFAPLLVLLIVLRLLYAIVVRPRRLLLLGGAARGAAAAAALGLALSLFTRIPVLHTAITHDPYRSMRAIYCLCTFIFGFVLSLYRPDEIGWEPKFGVSLILPSSIIVPPLLHFLMIWSALLGAGKLGDLTDLITAGSIAIIGVGASIAGFLMAFFFRRFTGRHTIA